MRQVPLGVEGQHGLLVATDQKERRHVLGQDVQPGEVESVRQRVILPRHRQRHQDHGRVSRVTPKDFGHPEVEVGLVGVSGDVR